jgi:uncharacterized protein (TIGR02996 family)
MTNNDFLHAIGHSPEDDTLRLAFADWLEERGDAERAEFIRLLKPMRHGCSRQHPFKPFA